MAEIELFCCHRDCGPGHPAEFEVQGGSGHFEDNSHSCKAHLGEMMNTPDWLGKDNDHWIVTRLEG